MLESYRILEVEPEPAFDPEGIESLGGKVKFWFQISEDRGVTDWLFKYPRPDTGEHWAEKIAAEVAGFWAFLAPELNWLFARAAAGQ